MPPIRIGMVGLGIMGRRYYRMLQNLEGVEVTALCVRHLDTIQDLAGAKFADYRLLCASGQVDAVLIATPHYSHPQVAIEALRCGLHVLVDKPLAVHVADGRRMLAAHHNTGIHLRRDSLSSITYSEELISATISATLQNTDRHHGIVGQERCHFQHDS